MASSAPISKPTHNYDTEREWLRRFIENFSDGRTEDAIHGNKKYMIEIQKVYDREKKLLEIHVEDLEEFFSEAMYRDFIDRVRKNTKRYKDLISEVASEMQGFSRRRAISEEEEFEEKLNEHQLFYGKSDGGAGKPGEQKRGHMIHKKIEAIIAPGPNAKQHITKIRNLRAEDVGSLVHVRGTVVRVTEVKPRIEIACYVCENCDSNAFLKVNQATFMPLVECKDAKCKDSRLKGNMVQNYSLSKFTPYQELMIQETPDQTPVGSIPRTFTVLAEGANVKQANPGDTVKLVGILLVRTSQSSRGRNDKLLHETYIQAMRIEKEKKSYSQLEVSEEDRSRLIELSRQPRIVTSLANSIAPEIFGMEEVKKALLLQMVGGSMLTMPDGMRIRGDLNLALIGDPGVAKSQLLKYVAHITPRGVYTTGKGSSGAGLTATIMRDPMTNEVSLEGGALVLADLGICCIDEFDKMEEGDRTSIHEVMEQQTISLAKAGITTRLNARTSILAAANPPTGRYNREKSPHENINLPFSLLSRFDLIFILLDTPNQVFDEHLAAHITFVHQHAFHPKLATEVLPEETLRQYIAQARTFNPTIAPQYHNFIIQKYVEKRKLNNHPTRKSSEYITPRTLLGVIRLSQAFAKLRFSNNIEQEDIVQALELMDNAQASIGPQGNEAREVVKQGAPQDVISRIFEIVRGCFVSSKARSLDEVQERVLERGFNRDDFRRCIELYETTGTLMNKNGTLMLM